MAKSQADLVKEVLRELTVISAVEEPSAEDSQFVADRWQTIHAMLSSTPYNLAPWPPNSIPERVFEPLTAYVAALVARKFGVSFENPAFEKETRLRALRAASALPNATSVAVGQFF